MLQTVQFGFEDSYNMKRLQWPNMKVSETIASCKHSVRLLNLDM